jgi:hypothetical protein
VFDGLLDGAWRSWAHGVTARSAAAKAG